MRQARSTGAQRRKVRKPIWRSSRFRRTIVFACMGSAFGLKADLRNMERPESSYSTAYADIARVAAHGVEGNGPQYSLELAWMVGNTNSGNRQIPGLFRAALHGSPIRPSAGCSTRYLTAPAVPMRSSISIKLDSQFRPRFPGRRRTIVGHSDTKQSSNTSASRKEGDSTSARRYEFISRLRHVAVDVVTASSGHDLASRSRSRSWESWNARTTPSAIALRRSLSSTSNPVGRVLRNARRSLP